MYDGNPRATADQVVELEKAGLDMVWVAEAYGFDSPTLMGYLAAKTETLQIGAGILNVFSRTPGALLQTAAGLDNVSAGGMVAIGEGPETKALLDFARPYVALYVGGMGARGKNFYNDLMRQYGYEKEAEEIQDLYLGGNKRDAEKLVPADLLELGNLVGPASYVKERIAAFAEAGVTNLQVMPASDDPAATIRQLRELVD